MRARNPCDGLEMYLVVQDLKKTASLKSDTVTTAFLVVSPNA